MEKEKAFKLPWGIFSGVFAMIGSYMIVAIVTIKVVSYLMIINSGGDDGLGETPLLIPLWIGAIVFTLGAIAFLVLYILRNKKQKSTYES